MRQARPGDTVAVHYIGRFDDGSVFDTSREGEPIEFELGRGSVISGFENAVEGMAIGQSREIRLEPDDAYGQRRDDLEVRVSRDRLPEDVEATEGQMLTVQVAPDKQTVARITEVGDDEVTLDLNHPLAGRTLSFEIELVGFRDES